MKFIFLFTIFIFISSCSNSLVSKDPSRIKAPFDGKRFSNIEPIPDKGFWEVLKWRASRMWDAKDWPDKINNPVFLVDQPRVVNPVHIYVINHATVLIQMNGLNILTDPIYSERCSPVSFIGPKRVIKPGIAWEGLPKIDLVLISHNHYDHLDLPTLKKLSKRDAPQILVGLGNAPLLQEEKIENVTEMDWWDIKDWRDIKVHFVPAQHWSARGPFDRKKTLWGGFVVEGRKRIYFAGDTGSGKFLSLIREKIGIPDISLLPIGAYEPRWFMKYAHFNPLDAVNAFIELGSKYAIGVHFATFEGLTDEGIDQPAKDLVKALEAKGIDKSKFTVPIFGQKYLF